MFRARKNRTYYYCDEDLQVHEIKRFHAKLSWTIAASIVICVSVLLLLNHLYYNFLDLGYNRMNSLARENGMLQEELSNLSAKLAELQSSLESLDQQGNHLRLLVDLKSVDKETQKAGSGGAVTLSELPLAGNNPVLSHVQTTLQQISSEISVQEQSYQQILQKYEYNKAYFAALPALKPMDGYYSADGFGLRMHPVLGIFKTHEGLDIVNDVGTPVYAAGDGTVEMAGHSGGGYGILVVLKHGFGFQTLYAHLSKVLVREGQHVKRGDQIARSGRTGLVTGPHLHYEVRQNGVFQNPVDYFLDDVSAKEYREKIAAR